jgi:hypothetical protein
MTEALTLIVELEKGFAAISDTDLSRVQRHLSAARDNERAMGTVHHIDARRLWALALAFESQTALLMLEAKFMANSDEESSEAMRKASRTRALEEVVHSIFWAQVKEDIGGDAWVADGGIGLRAGWLVVACPKSPIRGVIEQLLGGGE